LQRLAAIARSAIHRCSVVGDLMIRPARVAGDPARLVHFDLHARH
jgi:hypothetical protein